MSVAWDKAKKNLLGKALWGKERQRERDEL